MYSQSKLKKSAAIALPLIIVLAAATLIAPKVLGNGAGIPPPPGETNTATVTQAPNNDAQSSNVAPETPPPIGATTTSNSAEAPQSPPPPPVPSTAMLKDDALREIWHAYREYNATLELMNYASSNGVQTGNNVQYFKALAEDLYNKALTAYSNGNYVAAKSYARLSVESMHSLRDIVTYELSVKGIAPPPPTPPVGPPVPP